jgi:membrane protein
VLLSLAILIALPLVLDHIAHPDVPPALVKMIRWPILFVFADLVRIYRVGALLHLQIRSQPRRAAMALDHLGQRFCRDRMAHSLRLLSWYVANFGSYDKTYGSLGAIIGFMTWIWVSIIVVLVGAKLNAEIVWISEQEHLVTSST